MRNAEFEMRKYSSREAFSLRISHYALRLALLAAWSAIAADDKPAKTPTWDYSAPQQYEVTLADSSDTRLNGKRIDYKGRGNGEARLRVTLENSAQDARVLQALVSNYYGKGRNVYGSQSEYSFDASNFTELFNGRVVRDARLDGSREQRKELQRAQQQPWAEMTWGARGWQDDKLTAAGLVYSLAENLALTRQLLLLLPDLSSAPLIAGQTYELKCDVPYCVPAKNLPRLTGSYRIEKNNDGAAELSFSADADDTNRRGCEWGGIPIAALTARIKLKGRLSIDTNARVLMAGDMEWDVFLASDGDEFEATSRGRAAWKLK